jgi:voltage-gated potassium channel
MDEIALKETKTETPRAHRLQVTAGLFRFSVTQFLCALVVLLVTYPFVVEFEHGYAVETVLMTVVLVSAVLAVSGRTWGLAIILVIPALVVLWIEQYWPGLMPQWVMPCARMLFVGYVVVQLLWFISRARRVNSEVLCAGISGYLVMGLFWMSAYVMVSQTNPGSFSSIHPSDATHVLGRFDALYLSFVTLTCVGCNDITPLTKVARMLMMLESLAGVLYLAVLISSLVALYSKSAKHDSDDTSNA